MPVHYLYVTETNPKNYGWPKNISPVKSIHNARDKIEVATKWGISQGSEMLAINNRMNGIFEMCIMHDGRACSGGESRRYALELRK